MEILEKSFLKKRFFLNIQPLGTLSSFFCFKQFNLSLAPSQFASFYVISIFYHYIIEILYIFLKIYIPMYSFFKIRLIKKINLTNYQSFYVKHLNNVLV